MDAGKFSLIFTFAFVGIIIIGYLIGFWRGLKRSTLNFGMSTIAAIISFFCSGPLTKQLLGIRMTVNGQSSTLNGAIIEALKGNADIKLLLETTPSLEAFVSNLPYAIGNVIVFIVFAIVLQFLMYIVYKIFAAIFIKKKDKDGNKLPRYRLTGGIVGAIKVFILSLFVFMPLASLVGTVDDVARSNNLYGQDKNSPMYIAGEVVQGVNKSAFGVLGNCFGLDDAMFDYLSEFEINKEKINIRQEVQAYNSVYQTVSKFSVIFNGNDGNPIKDTDFKDMDKTVETVLSSGLYNTVISDVLNSVIVNYDKFSFIPADGTIRNVIVDIGNGLSTIPANEYFANDINAIYNAFKTLAQSGALDEKSSQDILAKLGGEYAETTKSALNQLFSMNILRDSTATLADAALSKILEGSDAVVANGRELTDEDWNSFADSIVNIASSYSKLSENVDLGAVVGDPTSLLTGEEDVTKTLTGIGEIVDEIRSIKILKNSNGDPVIDKFLTENDLTLPTAPVKNGAGEPVNITNYAQLMGFIAEPIETLKATGVYPLMKEEPVSNLKVFKAFTDALKEDDRTLHKIILPLYQVNPTKTIITDLLSGVGGDLVNFNALNSVEDYDSDLGYITKILLVLDKKGNNGETYLELFLNSGSEEMLKNLNVDAVDELIPPILYAKSTGAMTSNLFTTFEQVYSDLVDKQCKFNYNSVTFKETSAEDQAKEVAAVFKEFVAFYASYQTGDTVKNLDMIGLGRFIDRLKENAYRVEIAGKSDIGLFNEHFDAIVDKVATEFNIRDQIGNKEDYYKVNFTEIFTRLSEAQGA